MNFELTKTEQLFRQMIREFAENEVKPLAAEIDEEERFPMETVEKMAKLGMMAFTSRRNTARGGDVLSYAMCVEELAKVCGTTAVIVSAHTSLCCAPIFETVRRSRRKVPARPVLRQEDRCLRPDRANAGTDASGQQTLAVLEATTTSSTVPSASSPTATWPPPSWCSP